jgi:hypothetical protein
MDTDDRRAAVVCYHVAKKGYPILYAKRDSPTYPEDSGWQFLCYSGQEEKIEEAQLWAVDEVLKLEPSLRELIDFEPVTIASRKDNTVPWQITSTTEHNTE